MILQKKNQSFTTFNNINIETKRLYQHLNNSTHHINTLNPDGYSSKINNNKNRYKFDQQILNYDFKDVSNIKSINGLRSERHKLQQNQVLIENRLKYISLDHQKRKKFVKSNNNKINYLNQIKTSNQKMKQFLLNQKTMFENQNSYYVSKMKQKNLKEKSERRIKIQNWKQNHMKQIEPIKQLCRQHSKEIYEFKKSLEQKNKYTASKIKKRQQYIIRKLKAIQVKKQEQAKFNHLSKIYTELRRKQQSLKKNSYLSQKLQQTTRKIKNQVNNQQEINNYTIKNIKESSEGNTMQSISLFK